MRRVKIQKVRIQKAKMQKMVSGVVLLGVVFAGALVASWCSRIELPDPYQPAIASKVIRFHVLANSDSKEDQEVKLKVRDAVGTLMESRLTENAVQTIDDSRNTIEASLPDIISTAKTTLNENGINENVTAELTKTQFPVKYYGDYRFPAGEYEALEIVIGEGKGHNWWCVLYPNMCFRDSVYQVVDEESQKALKNTLTSEEYKDIFEDGNYEVRWKILDYFK